MTISARARDFVRRVKHSFKSDEQREFDDAEERAGYHQYKKFVDAEIERGRSGDLKILPADLWLRGSENCNLKCIGCYYPGRFIKKHITVEEARKNLSSAGKFRYISLTYGEAFLNPQICDVIEVCKELHPEAKVFIISNGTIPPKGRFRRAIELTDRLGLSIDGCTKETFEAIRVGSNFERFIENVKEIVDIRKETGGPKELVFSFTGTTTNLAELKGIVTLAHELGVPSIWAQAMETKGGRVAAVVDHLNLDNMDPTLRRKLIEDAKSEAIRLGVQLDISGGLYPPAATAASIDDNLDADGEVAVRMCRYPWDEPPNIGLEGDKYFVSPCCFIEISPKTRDALTERYGFSSVNEPSTEEAYNSTGMWKFREDLAAGRAADVCGNCRAAKSYAWNPPI